MHQYPKPGFKPGRCIGIGTFPEAIAGADMATRESLLAKTNAHTLILA